MNTTVLYENKWISLFQTDDPQYVYSHETRCNGEIVSALPYRIVNGITEYLVRLEYTPAWGTDQSMSSITGGYESGTYASNLIRELKEEAGYDIGLEHLRAIGTSRGTKSTDTVYYLYTADLTGLEQGKYSGDGSELESREQSIWVTEPDLIDASDPLIGMMYLRMKLLRIL